MYILFAAVLPPPKGVSKLVFGDGLQYLITAQLEALLGQQGASQLRLCPWEEEKKVRWDDIWQIRCRTEATVGRLGCHPCTESSPKTTIQTYPALKWPGTWKESS
jgi:hypothetical protein